jgi:hypothetical protein
VWGGGVGGEPLAYVSGRQPTVVLDSSPPAHPCCQAHHPASKRNTADYHVRGALWKHQRVLATVGDEKRRSKRRRHCISRTTHGRATEGKPKPGKALSRQVTVPSRKEYAVSRPGARAQVKAHGRGEIQARQEGRTAHTARHRTRQSKVHGVHELSAEPRQDGPVVPAQRHEHRTVDRSRLLRGCCTAPDGQGCACVRRGVGCQRARVCGGGHRPLPRRPGCTRTQGGRSCSCGR